MSMRICCVKDCFNSGRKLIKWKENTCEIHDCNFGTSRCICHPPFILLPFPTKQKNLHNRAVWIKNINRLEGNKIWTPTENSRVCSDHFVDRVPTELNPYPTLKLGYEFPTAVFKARPPPIDRSSIVPTPPKKRKSTDISLNSDCNEQTHKPNEIIHHDHDYSPLCHPCIEKSSEIAALKLKVKSLQSEVKTLKKLTRTNFKCENVFKSDKSVRFYTGIPSIAAFDALYKVIEPKIKIRRYWQGPKHFHAHILNNKKVYQNRSRRNLTMKEEMVLVLIKLKLGLLNHDLADIFNISESYVSKVFTTWIRILSIMLGSLVFNPPKEIVRENLPPSFRNKTYSSVRHIIDCTEVFLERPQNLEMQSQTWSDYKHHQTAKLLVSITPSGYINFVSKCWGGRTSDKYITNNSGFLNIVEPFDTVMADRGFQIQEELTLLKAYLLVPPGRRGACQMSETEVKKTKQIANRRIYIEQAIRRLKYFRILKYELPITLAQHLDYIVRTCAGICNLYPPLPKYV